MDSAMKFIEQGRAELMEKTYQDIQKETALKWAGRAYAAYEVLFRLDSEAEQIGWFHVGEEYRHEALEHAALIEDAEESDQTIATVRGMLSDMRDMAIEMVYSSGPYEDELSEESPADTSAEDETVAEALDAEPTLDN